MYANLEQALLGTLEADPSVRAAAEQHLTHAGTQPGFGPLLVQTARNEQVPESLRQLALVVLKHFVKEHWDENSKHFKPPKCNQDDKNSVRQMLPQCLADSSSKVRTATAMAISSIATYDFPNQWPGLLEWMVASVQQQQNHYLVLGVLKCLSMIAEDIGDQLPQVVPVLLPSLHAIISNPAYPASVHRHVLSILHAILAHLGMMQGAFQRQVRDLLVPLLEPWMPTLAAVLGAPLTKDPKTWRMKMECLTVVTGIATYFGKVLADHIPRLLAPCWQTFTGTGRALYQELLVEGKDDDDEAGDDAHEDEGEPVGLEAMLSQMFELLLTLVGSPRFSKLLKPHLYDLSYVNITYMQMTADQCEVWATNPNMYVADEDDVTCTARVSGELLLDELCRSYGSAAIKAILDCINKAMADAELARQQSAVSGHADSANLWWRLREAALTAAGCVAQSIADSIEEEGNASKQTQHVASLQALLDRLIQEDLQGPHSTPFLAGRALWASARMSRFMTPQHVDMYLSAACAGIRGSHPAPVRVGACRALVQLLPRLGGTKNGRPASSPDAEAKLAPILPALYEGLVQLLKESTEETQHLVLETLEVVIKMDSNCVVQQYLGHVAGPVIHVWEECVADPLIGEDATNVLGAVAAHPQCLAPLVGELLPALVRVIGNPVQQRPMLVEGSLSLLRTLVRRPAPPSRAATGGRLTDASHDHDAVVAQHLIVVQQVYVAIASPLLTLIDTSDDGGVQQEAQQLLCQLVRTGRTSLLSWGGVEPSVTVNRLWQSVFRLLSGEVGEMESALAGHLATDFLLSFPQELTAPHTHKLLELVCARLLRINYAPLVSGLILVLSRLAHVNCHGLIDALATMQVNLPSGQAVSALAGVLPIWADRAVDVNGRYYTTLVNTALGLLLESQHPALQQLQVRGKRLDVGSGVQTRSQLAASGGEQYAVALGPMKVISALAQTLADAQEAEDMTGLPDDEAEFEDDDDSDEYEETDDEGGQQGSQHGSAAARLAIHGASFTPAQHTLLRSLSKAGTDDGSSAWHSVMAMGDATTGQLSDTDNPLSPGSVLHDDSNTGADDAAPPNDPIVKLDLGRWVSELFQRIALREGGNALLQAAGNTAMSRKQVAAVQKLLNTSRLRV